MELRADDTERNMTREEFENEKTCSDAKYGEISPTGRVEHALERNRSKQRAMLLDLPYKCKPSQPNLATGS